MECDLYFIFYFLSRKITVKYHALRVTVSASLWQMCPSMDLKISIIVFEGIKKICKNSRILKIKLHFVVEMN